MFNPSIEDDDLFIPENSSNLAELFGVTSSISPGNADLTYVAPKQPKDISKSQLKGQEKVKAQNAVLFAKVAVVYKTDGDSLKLVGKYGIALIGDSSGAKEIMIYKDKQNILVKITLTSDSEIHIGDDYIKIGDQWHIQFDEQKSSVEFIDELKKAKVKIVKKERSRKSSSNIDNTDNNTKEEENETGQVIISQTRADILSRMAKMGQSILPNNNIKSKSPVMDDSPNSPPIIKAKSNERDINENLNPIHENTRNNNNVNQFNSPINSGQLSPYIPVYQSDRLPINTTVISSQEFNLFASENRIQNSEMRMNLSSMSTKLDNVLNEISKLREPNTDKLENEFLKSKILDLEKNINELTKRLEEVDNSKGKYSRLEILLKDKDQEIKDHKDKVIELEGSLSKIAQFESEKDELNQKIRTLQGQLNDSENTIKVCKSEKEVLVGTNESLLKNNQELNCENNLLKAENKAENLDETVKGFSDIIKQSMNLMYQNITGQLDESQEQTEIKTILSKNIRQTTLGVIQRFLLFVSNNSPKNNEPAPK